MPFVRRIVNSNILAGIIDVPEGLKNKKVEVLVFSLEDNTINDTSNKKHKLAKGILAKYKNPAFIEKESTAWGEAVKEKHEYR